MARWEDALDAQMEFVQRMRSNEMLRGITRAFFKVEREKDRLQYSEYDIMTMPDRLAVMAYNSDPVWVDPDMQTLWEGTVDTFTPEPLVPEDLIAPAGFIWLPRPYASHDVHGRVTTTRAIMWHPQGMVIRYPEGQDKVDEWRKKRNASDEYVPLTDGATMFPATKIRDGEFESNGILLTLLHLTSDKDEYTDGTEPPGLLVQHSMPWAFGQQWGHLDKRPITDGILAFQALWRLMQEKIASKVLEQPDRHTRKRAERANIPARRITVIRLRRTEPPREHSDEAKTVNWTHRWVVEPYWRRQWYPSLGMHRNKLVMGHIRGPAHLPLIVRKGRVFSWSR